MAAQDKWPNLKYQKVTESAANTLTFAEMDFGVSLFDKVGLVISRMEWYTWHENLSATADAVSFGLSQSNTWSAPSAGESSIIMFHEIHVRDYGTAGNNQIFREPIVDDWSNLPGGGLLVVPRPMYLFTKGANLGAASAPELRMYFTIMTLKPEEYFELLETRQFFG